MKRSLLIITKWSGEQPFNQLRNAAEQELSSHSIQYLIFVDSVKELETIKKAEAITYFAKKDFSFFGRIKTVELKEILTDKKITASIYAVDQPFSVLKRILKHSSHLSIGIEDKTLPEFDISFQDSKLEGGMLFRHINNYITKIQS